MKNRKVKKHEFRPDARHSSFWTDMMPMGIVYSVVVVLLVMLLNYLGVFQV
ncbi:MAG: hypothetical protein ACI83H_002264 [Glaciecola sp.]|jgi:hypothetical protein